MKKQLLTFLLMLLGLHVLPQLPISDNKPPSKADDLTEEQHIIPAIDANYEIERVYKQFFKMDVLLQPDKGILEVDSLFNIFSEKLNREATSFHSFNPNSLSRYFLESNYRLWGGFYLKLGLWQLDVNKRIKAVQVKIDELEHTINLWERSLGSKEYELIPNNLKIRIVELVDKANDYRSQFHQEKRNYILLEDGITDQIAFANQILVEIDALQQNRRDSLFIAKDPNMFQLRLSKADYLPVIPRFERAFNESFKTIENYFASQTLFWFVIVSLLFLAFFTAIRRRYLAMSTDPTEPGHKTILRIFQGHPTLTVITMMMVFFHLLYPFYPLILNHLLTLVLLINMFFILKRFIDAHTRKFIFRLVILLLINDLEIIMWYFGDVARYYILFETLLGIAFSINYIRPGLWKNFMSQTYINRARLLLASLIFIFYTAAFFANLIGFYDLSVLLLSAGIHVPEFTVLLYGLYLIVKAISHAFIRYLRSKQNVAMAQQYMKYERIADNTAKTLAFIYWFFSLTVSFQINRLIFSNFFDFLEVERNFGLVKITYASVLSFLLIIFITMVLTRIVKYLVERLLRNSGLPRGIPSAIAVTLSYLIVAAGFFLALSIAGIDLGKFGFIAGALGVGIGFGLQNIVNNFISGLILIYERPLQIGDTIEVENLLGKVNRIGVRSSNVRTFDGAEVVVPNGNLISNQVINWTLSDSIRRIELKVGAAYGSDPNQVIKLLATVAQSNPVVLQEPMPLALFDGFGDSSLNFRLLFWVAYDQSLVTKSEIAVGVYNIFKEHGIEIPFPQVDVNMKNKK